MQGRREILKSSLVSFWLIVAHLTTPAQALAESTNPSQTNVRARYSNSSTAAYNPLKSTVRFEPIELRDGGRLTIVSPPEWEKISNIVKESLLQTHQRLTSYFGLLPAVQTSIRLIDEETFFLTTGAPRWTNALFLRDQIILPLPGQEQVDVPNLERSVRHEYTHAVIHALSNGRCPGWLDEGLAQWMEGPINPLLVKAFQRWLLSHNPLPLSMLQNGFTQLNPSMVPAAYAQSLYAAQSLITEHGFTKIRNFLESLKADNSQKSSFDHAFEIKLKHFEKGMKKKIDVSLLQ